MRALLLATPVLLFAVAGSAAEPSSWQSFASAEGDFRVLLPAPPVVLHESRSTFLGEIRETRHVTQVGAGQATVEHHDIPGIAIDIMPDRVILDRARASLIAAAGGEQSLERAYTWNGYPAREVTYRIPGDTPMFERVRLILAGKRLYVVTASWRAPEDIPAQLVSFLESFELTATRPVSAGLAAE